MARSEAKTDTIPDQILKRLAKCNHFSTFEFQWTLLVILRRGQLSTLGAKVSMDLAPMI
jgi:hypothetical protein